MNARNDVKRPSELNLDARRVLAAARLRFAARVDFLVARWLERCATNFESSQRLARTPYRNSRIPKPFIAFVLLALVSLVFAGCDSGHDKEEAQPKRPPLTIKVRYEPQTPGGERGALDSGSRVRQKSWYAPGRNPTDSEESSPMQLRLPTDTEAIIANARSIGPIIEEEADKFAKERRLTDDVVALMRRAGLFRIAFPKAWGGPEMDILSQCEVMETLGYHDASAAWVAMICSDSGHYAARIDETEARALYPSLDLLTAGMIAPTGQAHIVDDGLKVSGRWPFGSGCLHADRLVAGCVLFENGKPQMGAGGRPEFRVVWLPKDKVQIHDTWYTTGLAGSGSNDYSVQDIVVPRAHSFHPFRVGTRTEPLYRYHGFFFANLPAVAFGCARRMIDDFRELAQRKITPPALTPLKNEYRAQVALAEANMRLSAARAYQDSSLGSVWQTLSRGETPTAAQRAAVGMMAIHGLQEALKVGEIVCEAAGTAALYASSPLERRRRDLITMSNHIIGQRRTQQAMGQLLFGEEVMTHV